MIIILDNIRSAHNVGSIFRTCDALGIKELHLCGITPGLDDRKVPKTALGAEKNLTIVEKTDCYEDLSDLRSKGVQIIGLEISDKAIDISGFRPDRDSALVIGNEICGLSKEILDMCDVVVNIPMKGIKESLNVSVAFGIAAYELTKA